MGRYFKATRVDGTDFRTGTVDYAAALASGQPVVPNPVTPDEQLSIDYGHPGFCRPGRLYAADAPGMTLVGGPWPCRLFIVEGDPVEGFDWVHAHKGAFHRLTVVEELPGWQALGGNGEQAAAFIARFRAANDTDRDKVWDRFNALPIADVSDAWGRVVDALYDGLREHAKEAVYLAVRHAAPMALMDAVVARDLIPAADYDLLTNPWRTVIGEPL
jgi:hypothetical protein